MGCTCGYRGDKLWGVTVGTVGTSYGVYLWVQRGQAIGCNCGYSGDKLWGVPVGTRGDKLWGVTVGTVGTSYGVYLWVQRGQAVMAGKNVRFPRNMIKFPTQIAIFPNISYVFLCFKLTNFPPDDKISWEPGSPVPYFFQPRTSYGV